MLPFSVPFATSAFLGLRINRLCYGSALCVTSARSKTCDVLCIPARYLVTLAILSGGVCSPLLHFPAKAGLETRCWMECDTNYLNSPVFNTGMGSPCHLLHVSMSLFLCAWAVKVVSGMWELDGGDVFSTKFILLKGPGPSLKGQFPWLSYSSPRFLIIGWFLQG